MQDTSEPESLQAARQAWEEERERDRPRPGPTFDYGMQLVNNSRRANKHLGVCLLTDVIDEGYETRRCLLAIARAYFDLGEYHQSRIHIERLLKRDPNNAQALELHRQIREVVSKDGPIGLLIAGGAFLLGALLVRRWLRGASVASAGSRPSS